MRTFATVANFKKKKGFVASYRHRSFLLIGPGSGFSWEAVTGISSSCHRPGMLRAMKPCCPGTGCGLSPSRSTSMISKTSATCWVPLSPFHIRPSPLAPSTPYKCGPKLSFPHFCVCFFFNAYACLILFRLFFLLTWSGFEKSWPKTATSCGPSLVLNRGGRTGQYVLTGLVVFAADSKTLICTLTIFYCGFPL